MKIHLSKFGSTLTSRQLGKEALAAFQPSLRSVGQDEIVEVDFDGVITFSPSWGDEFLTPLARDYEGRMKLSHTKNPSVSLSLKLLEEVNGIHFEIQ
ncbi:MAG: hypothetical protein AAB390_04415 [Patescibacteria group bacterium]